MNLKNTRLQIRIFLKNLEEEKIETQEAIKILIDHTIHGKRMTKKEKESVEEQLKDVAKTLGLIGTFALPGGSLILLAARMLKWDRHMLPSSFKKEKEIKK